MSRLLVSAAVSALTATLAATEQRAVFRSSGDTVRAFVTVTDKANRLVTNLVEDNFQILDNGQPQPITLFDNRPQPISLVLVLDISVSMADKLTAMRTASEVLFDAMREDDVARVITFGNEIQTRPGIFTRDVAMLRGALPVRNPSDVVSPLWAAIEAAMTALQVSTSRKVVLVLSDGKNAVAGDTGNRRRDDEHAEVSERAQRENVMIYSVGLHSAPKIPIGARLGSGPRPAGSNLPDPTFGTVALETGGGYFEVAPRDDLGTSFARVADELHSQYLIGFSPRARDGRSHRVEVRLAPKDLKARIRKSYTAPRQ